MLAKTLFIYLACCLFLSSCQLRVPSLQEQDELIKQGAFPGGVPPWVVTSAHPEIQRNYSGVVPSVFSRMNRTEKTAQDREEDSRESANQDELKQNKQREDAPITQPERIKKADSPIQRINDVCPGLEADVSKAVITEDSTDRLIKYKSLVTRCGKSYDLWFWLGKEYLSEGSLEEAKHSFEQVLILNREHQEAIGLLNQLRESRNSTRTTTK